MNFPELPPRDVSPQVAARIRRRALSLLARSAGIDESTLAGRLEGVWVRVVEPVLVGGFSVAYAAWAIVFVLAR